MKEGIHSSKSPELYYEYVSTAEEFSMQLYEDDKDQGIQDELHTHVDKCEWDRSGEGNHSRVCFHNVMFPLLSRSRSFHGVEI